jgi:hypothetical protein
MQNHRVYKYQEEGDSVHDRDQVNLKSKEISCKLSDKQQMYSQYCQQWYLQSKKVCW